MTTSGPVRDRDLRVVAGAICVSALGDWIALVALGLRANEMSGGPMGNGLAIAGIFICLWAPVVLLAGHVGLLVDRVETRGLLVLVSAAQACVALALAFVGSLWALFALAALLGSGIAVAQAAEFALVPAVAGARTLQAANGTVETARALGFAVGPLCGSLLVAAGGTAAAMIADAVSFVAVGAVGLSLAVRRRPERAEHEGRRRARDGIAFLFADRLVALMVVVVFVSLLFMSASIPADLVYVQDVLGVEDIGIGIVLSAWTVGMLAGSNVLARRVSLGGLAAAAMVGVTVQGLGKFLTPFWLVFGFMIVMYVVGGIGHGLKNVTSRTLIHTRVAPERHGRAFAAWNGVRNAAELGALAVGGVLVGALGARETLWLAGGLSALAGIAGLAVLAGWRGRMPEPEPEVGTIGSP
ncbi:MAG TPA: MFS transporter [Gaiella sp.]|nr:MFS transporter [Gaiella sp.]